MPLHMALFIETNPSPVKYALSALGRMSDEVRLPLVPMSSETAKQSVRSAMAHAGLLNV
jgi:4-hydroxy-tetrahydrodipicolinate synthase